MSALTCSDVEGIDQIKLTEVQLFFPGSPWEIVTRKSDDLFQLLLAQNQQFPQAGRIIRASFRLKFHDAKKPRTVVIKPSNVAQFIRDDDSELVEKWLGKRGFLLAR